MGQMKFIKIDNSKKSAVKNGKWKNPGAKFYDTLMDAMWCDGEIPADPKEMDEKIKEGKYYLYDKFLKEAYLVGPDKDHKNSPYGRTPFARSGCKYPHHVIKGDKMVVSIPGLRSAYITARNQGCFHPDPSKRPEYSKALVTHINRHFKELGLKPVWHHGEFYLMEETDIKIEQNFNNIYSFIMEKTGINLFDQVEVFEEKSHGKLKFSFRMGINRDNGHLIKVVFDLNKDDVLRIGSHDDTNRVPRKNQKEIKDHITKTGYPDFISAGTVKAIVDMDTKESLNTVVIVGIMNGNQQFALKPLKERERIISNGGQFFGATRFTVGDKEEVDEYGYGGSYKTTVAPKSAEDLSTKHNGKFLTGKELIPYGRGYKANHRNLFESAMSNEAIILNSNTKKEIGTTPEEIYEWMHSNIQYDDTTTGWKLRTPSEVYMDKKGNCHDQALFEAFHFHSLNIINGQLFFVEFSKDNHTGGRTHTLTWFREGGNGYSDFKEPYDEANAYHGPYEYYWFENAWEDQAGIHGPYADLDELKDAVLEACKKDHSDNCDGVVFGNTNNYRCGMNLNEYVESWRLKDDHLFDESNVYDPPLSYDKLPQHLKNDEVHSWRAKTGIELIHKEPSIEELERIWANWQLMTDEQKRISDQKSIELFGMNNEDHYNQLRTEYISEGMDWIRQFVHDDEFRESVIDESSEFYIESILSPSFLEKIGQNINEDEVIARNNELATRSDIFTSGYFDKYKLSDEEFEEVLNRSIDEPITEAYTLKNLPDKMYFGTPNKISGKTIATKSPRGLFMTPYVGIASMFIIDISKELDDYFSEILKKNGRELIHHSCNIDYDEWGADSKELKKPLSKCHMSHNIPEFNEVKDGTAHGYIYQVDVSKIKNQLQTYATNNPDRELIYKGADKLPITGMIEHTIDWTLRYKSNGQKGTFETKVIKEGVEYDDDELMESFDESFDELLELIDLPDLYYTEAKDDRPHDQKAFMDRWKYDPKKETIKHENREYQFNIHTDIEKLKFKYPTLFTNVNAKIEKPLAAAVKTSKGPIIVVNKDFWGYEADVQDAVILHEIGHIVCQMSPRPFPKSIKELIERIKRAIQRLVARIRMMKYTRGVHGNPYHELEADMYAMQRTSRETMEKMLNKLYEPSLENPQVKRYIEEECSDKNIKKLYDKYNKKDKYTYEQFKAMYIKKYRNAYQKKLDDIGKNSDHKQREKALNDKKLGNSKYFKKESSDIDDLLDELIDEFDEAGHHKPRELGKAYRVARDSKNNHELLIVYSLDGMKIDMDPRFQHHTSYMKMADAGCKTNEDRLNYIRKYGNTDFKSSGGKIEAILDLNDNKKSLSEADCVGAFGYNNNDVFHIKVGDVETVGTFKSTFWPRGGTLVNKINSATSSTIKGISQREKIGVGRGAKMNDFIDVTGNATGEYLHPRKSDYRKKYKEISQVEIAFKKSKINEIDNELKINKEKISGLEERINKETNAFSKKLLSEKINKLLQKNEKLMKDKKELMDALNEFDIIDVDYNDISSKHDSFVSKSKELVRNGATKGELYNIRKKLVKRNYESGDNIMYECGFHEGTGIDGDDLDWIEKYLMEEGENLESPVEEEPEPEKQSMPKQTDAAESDKNGVRRKKLYIAFIEWCKEYNPKNTFGSIFDKDVFHVSYPFVPEEMRYFYRLANPILCVLGGELTFFQVSELRKLNAKNSRLNEFMIFAATPNDMRIFNRKDKKVYRGTEENGVIKLNESLGDTFDIYIQKMIKKGDILNGPIEESTEFEW